MIHKQRVIDAFKMAHKHAEKHGSVERTHALYREAYSTLRGYIREALQVHGEKPFTTAWGFFHLALAIEAGLSPLYETPYDFFYDWWPDLPWDTEQRDEVVRAILKHPLFKAVAKRWEECYHLDIKAELEGGLGV